MGSNEIKLDQSRLQETAETYVCVSGSDSLLSRKDRSEACPPLCAGITSNISCFLEGNHRWDDDGYDNKVIARTVHFWTIGF